MNAPELARLMDRLGTTGAAALASLDDETLLAAWGETVEAFLDPRSPERTEIEPALVASSGLSPQGLAAGLEAVLGGVRMHHAEALLRRTSVAQRTSPGTGPPQSRRAPALAVLAGNLPALAVQPLLPALAVRRPLLLKSSSSEPYFAPAFVAMLTRRLPALADAVAAVSWPGGDTALEAPVLAAAHCVLAYGDRATVADLARRADGKVIDYGPKLSFAVVAADAELASAARGIARDVALFDQRGCLSVQAVFVEGEATRARSFGIALVTAIDEIAATLPPGPVDAGLAAAVQQVRGEAELRGALVGSLSLAAGTVLLESADASLAPSPGLRTVRVYALATLAELPLRLVGWEPLLQGTALAGNSAWELAPTLAALGVSRCAEPGELQSPDASWHNGGHDPLNALA
ncbi:MAG TPA: acyl-CoA reductase [Thermoanaerobaculia bacterium]|nr:acyl-CoA reductase [Thermoanaerobaculia bacterium]HXT51502.1 acyl-CoA reductase [Thermoanaerobaculia bacterium]